MPLGLGAQGGQGGWNGNAGESLHPLHAVILAAGDIRTNGGEDSGGELVGRSGGEHHCGGIASVGFRCGPAAGGMGVHQVALLPVDPADDGFRLGVIAVPGGKFCLDGREKRVRHPVEALLIQVLHEPGH